MTFYDINIKLVSVDGETASFILEHDKYVLEETENTIIEVIASSGTVQEVRVTSVGEKKVISIDHLF
jgi:hypothetical protein